MVVSLENSLDYVTLSETKESPTSAAQSTGGLLHFVRNDIFILGVVPVVAPHLTVVTHPFLNFPPSLGKGGQGGWGKISNHSLMQSYRPRGTV